MMHLKVLGSGSDGNCYLLENERECLVLDAGVSFAEVKKALNFNVRKIVGVAVTHSHKDHSRHLKSYEKAGIASITPYLDFYTVAQMGNFLLKAFPLVHDVPCFGFAVTHPDFGMMLYVTDTEYCPIIFSEWRPNVLLVEANYSFGLMGDVERKVKDHVVLGHMELETTLEFLRVNDSPALKHVVLCHLSRERADPDQFREAAKKAVSCPVDVAKPGLVINVSEVPFL